MSQEAPGARQGASEGRRPRRDTCARATARLGVAMPSPADTHAFQAPPPSRFTPAKASRGLAGERTVTACSNAAYSDGITRSCAATSKNDGRSSPEPSSRFMFISSGLKERWPVEPRAGSRLQPAAWRKFTHSKKSGWLPSGWHPRYSRRPGAQVTGHTQHSQFADLYLMMTCFS